MSDFDAAWRARFERFGQNHAEEHAVSGWSAEGLARRFRLFGRVLASLPVPERADVLELGCGAGTYVRYLAGLGHVVVGVDYAQPSLARAVEADPGRKGRYVAADGYDLPFRQGSFDLVMCIGVLQASGGPERILDEIARIARPGGLVLVEALNALEIPAMARRAVERIGGRSARLRAYPRSRVRRWLEARGVRPVRLVEVFLPPRGLPSLGRLLDAAPVGAILERTPAAGFFGAHAFWVVGRKAT